MPTNSPVKGLLFLHTIVRDYLPCKPRLQVSRHIAKSAKVKLVSSLIWLVIWVGLSELVGMIGPSRTVSDSTCSPAFR